MSITTFPPPAVPLPPMRAGETDGRYMDCTPDLGPTGDTFPSVGALSITISRQDGEAVTSADLQSAGAAWPNTLDSTGLIPTFGFTAPPASAGVGYNISLKADTTTQGRVFVRDWTLQVMDRLG